METTRYIEREFLPSFGEYYQKCLQNVKFPDEFISSTENIVTEYHENRIYWADESVALKSRNYKNLFFNLMVEKSQKVYNEEVKKYMKEHDISDKKMAQKEVTRIFGDLHRMRTPSLLSKLSM